MDPRRRTTAAAAAVLAGLLLAACSNDPQAYPHGEQAGETDATGLGVMVILGMALVSAAIIGLLAYLPGLRRGSRYRPQKGWDAPPVWFAGPSDPVDAVQQAQPGDVKRGGTGGDW